MNIFITGGAGMVGSHCAEYFASAGHNVLVYDNLMRSEIFQSEKESVEYNWQYLVEVQGVALTKGDVRNWSDLLGTMKEFQPDIVIHAAAQPGVRMSLEKPIEDFSINAVGTLNVLEGLRQVNPNGVLIYCSTNKVYGANVDRHELKEEQKRYCFRDINGINESESVDRTGHTPYGVSKLSGELYVQDYAYTYGLRTGVFRMSCIYGTRQFGFEDQGWIAWFCSRYLTDSPITLYGDGKQVRDVLWVGDLISAFDNFIQSDIHHEVFNIGGGPANSLSLLELIDNLEKITDRSVVVQTSDWRKFDQKVYISDITKVCTLLKWNPMMDPMNGVGRLMAWIEDNRELFQS